MGYKTFDRVKVPIILEVLRLVTIELRNDVGKSVWKFRSRQKHLKITFTRFYAESFIFGRIFYVFALFIILVGRYSSSYIYILCIRIYISLIEVIGVQKELFHE